MREMAIKFRDQRYLVKVIWIYGMKTMCTYSFPCFHFGALCILSQKACQEEKT